MRQSTRRRSAPLLVLLLTACRAVAQPDDHGPEPPLTEHLVEGKLIDWQIEGDIVSDKHSITIGGKSPAKLRLLKRMGDQFYLRLEYQFTGPPPTLVWHTNQTRSWSLVSPGPNRWAEFTTRGAQGTWRSGSQWRQATRAMDGGFSSTGGLYVGAGPLREFNIVVPANSTLTLRRLALYTTPVVERSPYGLTAAIAVLVGVLAGIMALGWFLNRRRSAAAAPGPSVSE